MVEQPMTKELLDLLRFRRLDSRNGFASGDENTVQLMAAAADEIERLRTANAQMLEHGREMWADVERLRALLVQWEGNCTGRHGSQSPCGFTADHVVPADRAAVEPEQKT